MLRIRYTPLTLTTESYQIQHHRAKIYQWWDYAWRLYSFASFFFLRADNIFARRLRPRYYDAVVTLCVVWLISYDFAKNSTFLPKRQPSNEHTMQHFKRLVSLLAILNVLIDIRWKLLGFLKYDHPASVDYNCEMQSSLIIACTYVRTNIYERACNCCIIYKIYQRIHCSKHFNNWILNYTKLWHL